MAGRLILLLMCLPTMVVAGTLTVQLPASLTAKSATAVSKTNTLLGQLHGGKIDFALPGGEKFDIAIELSDGTQLQGVDCNWYTLPPASTGETAPLDEDDRQQIAPILHDIKSFFDRTEAVCIRGDHDRAVAVVQRTREAQFYGGKQDEAIWRVEIWYLENQAGGWAKIGQQDKTIRRERFDSTAKMHQTINRIRWISELGGIELPVEQTVRLIRLESSVAATQPSPLLPAR